MKIFEMMSEGLEKQNEEGFFSSHKEGIIAGAAGLAIGAALAYWGPGLVGKGEEVSQPQTQTQTTEA